MNANQLTNALVDAAAAAKPAQEYCLLGIDWWATCMTKAEWSGWMQAIGAIVALFIAIGIPWSERRNKRIEESRRVAYDAAITVRFHKEILGTNSELLDVALAHLPGGNHAHHLDWKDEVLLSIRSLRSLSFENVCTIGSHDPDFALVLADFHRVREELIGVVDRNGDDVLPKHLKTVVIKVNELKALAVQIQKIPV